MKLTLLTASLAAVLTLTCATAQAQTNAAPAAASTSTATTTSTTTTTMDKTNYGGTVTAVDTTANTVSVHSKKHDLTLMVTGDTKYKGATALSDVKVGDKVKGSYTKDAAGKMTACTVNKKAAK